MAPSSARVAATPRSTAWIRLSGRALCRFELSASDTKPPASWHDAQAPAYSRAPVLVMACPRLRASTARASAASSTAPSCPATEAR